MQKVRNVARCEFCKKDIELESPPPRTQYERGRIEIGNLSTVLLDKPSSSKAHAADISGYYCDSECLVGRITELRNGCL